LAFLSPIVLPILGVAYVWWSCDSYESTCKTANEQQQERKDYERKPSEIVFGFPYTIYPNAPKEKGIQIQTSPTCSTKCEIKKKTLDEPVALFTLLLGYLVLLQLTWMARQEKVLNASVEVAKTAAEAAKKSADAAVRIYLPVLLGRPDDLAQLDSPIPADGGTYGSSPVQLVPTRYSGISWVEFINHGRSEAFPINLLTGWSVTAQLPNKPVYNHGHTLPHSSVIKSGDKFKAYLYRTIELSEREIAEIRTEKSWLWFYGTLIYQDFMGDQRESRFCSRWAKRHPDDISAFFAGDGNPPPEYTKQT
jgi:hypothetical protein